MTNNRFVLLCIAISLGLGIWARAYFIAPADFPLGDGSLFLQAMEDIQRNNYLPAASIHYNRIEIPLGYPPLGFYLALGAVQLTRLPEIVVARWLPLAYNLLVIVAFVLLAAQWAGRRVTLLLASIIFPLISWSYEWMIMVGGLTRGPAFLATLLALLSCSRWGKTGKNAWLALGGLCAGLAGLSHPEWGLTALAGVSLLLLTTPQPLRRRLLALAGVNLLALALVVPWYGLVIERHGLGPLNEARQTGGAGSLWDNFQIVLTGLPIDTYGLAPLVFLGVYYSFRRRFWFPAAWLAAIYIVTPRHARNPGSIPVAYLAAEGVTQLLDWLEAAASRWKPDSQRLAPAIKAGLVALTLAYMLSQASTFHQYSTIGAITPDQRTLMQWIKSNTPQKARFLLLTSQPEWGRDWASEWFPYLTRRESLLTMQGYEWVSREEFIRRNRLRYNLYNEYSNHRGELPGYILENFPQADYLVVLLPDAATELQNFTSAPAFEPVYQQPDAIIYKIRTNP